MQSDLNELMFEIKPGYVKHSVIDGEVLLVDLYDKEGNILGSHVKIGRFPVQNINIIDPSISYP